MFRNTRGASGLGGLVAVAVVIGAYLTMGGLMWKAYADGGRPGPAAELVCTTAASPGVKC